ncbi:MAG TPA: S41 family peptidase [Fontimonas sp.]
MRVMYVDEGAPADRAGVQRGARITHIDGNATDRMSEAAIRDALYPRAEGDQHRFTFESAGTAVSHTLVAERVAKDPVPQAQLLHSGDRTVGYLLFNDHFETAEAPLIAAIEQFRDAGVDDLIVDLRYNGGGYLYIASQLAYMIAGPERVGGRVFERLVFNERRQQQLSGSQVDFPFVDCRSEGNFDCRNGTLPTLDLPRLHVITGGGSCSASEALINGLRGIDVDVRLIGDTTCGKPFGFYARDNCGLTYFPIEFQGVNAKGYGDYADGFPADCAAADDLDHALGDPRERMLAAALRLQSGAACGSAKSLSHGHTLLFRPPPRENRLLRSH